MQLVGHAYIIDYIVFYAVSAICHAYTKESMWDNVSNFCFTEKSTFKDSVEQYASSFKTITGYILSIIFFLNDWHLKVYKRTVLQPFNGGFAYWHYLAFRGDTLST